MNFLLNKIKILFKTGFFHIFGSSVLNKAIAFLSSIVLVRILSKTEYGVFTYAWNIYSIILIFNGMGIDSGVLQIISEKSGDTEHAKSISNYGTRFGVKFNILLFITILGIGLFAPLKISNARGVLCLLSLLPMAQILFQMTLIYLRSQKRNLEFSNLTVANSVFLFTSSVGGAIAFKEKGLVLGYYFAYLITFVLGYIFCHIRLFDNTSKVRDEDKKALLKIAAISMCNNGLSQLMYLLDIFVLGIVDPQETILASYKVATMIPSALIFIPTSLVTYIYPYFAEHQNDSKWCLKYYKKILAAIGCLNAFISFVLFIASPFIISVFFGNQYLDSVPVFRILAINYFFSGTFRIISGNLLVTQRKLRFNLFVAIITSIVNVTADFFFIQWWGSIGAALATLLVVVTSSVISTPYLIYTFKQNKKPFS